MFLNDGFYSGVIAREREGLRADSRRLAREIASAIIVPRVNKFGLVAPISTTIAYPSAHTLHSIFISLAKCDPNVERERFEHTKLTGEMCE